MCTNCGRSEKPSSARLVFSDVIVNNNKSTNSRRDDHLPAEKARHDAYRWAQFASFNLTNALICVVGSSKERPQQNSSFALQSDITAGRCEIRLGRTATPYADANGDTMLSSRGRTMEVVAMCDY